MYYLILANQIEHQNPLYCFDDESSWDFLDSNESWDLNLESLEKESKLGVTEPNDHRLSTFKTRQHKYLECWSKGHEFLKWKVGRLSRDKDKCI